MAGVAGRTAGPAVVPVGGGSLRRHTTQTVRKIVTRVTVEPYPVPAAAELEQRGAIAHNDTIWVKRECFRSPRDKESMATLHCSNLVEHLRLSTVLELP